MGADQLFTIAVFPRLRAMYLDALRRCRARVGGYEDEQRSKAFLMPG